MANHKVPVPTWLDASYVEKRLSQSLKLPDLQIKTMDITPGSKAGDNYSCQILRISTVYISNCKETKLSLIAKCMVFSDLMANVGGGTPFFDVETTFYKNIEPKIKEISGNKESIGPEVYFVDSEKYTIFMEDITARGFKVQDRHSFLSIEQCYLVMDALAALHGTSYYLLKKNQNLTENFKNYYWGSCNNASMNAYNKNAENAIRNNIKKFSLSETHQKKLFGVFETLRKDDYKVCLEFHPPAIFSNNFFTGF